jgi:hypothetical protein
MDEFNSYEEQKGPMTVGYEISTSEIRGSRYTTKDTE